MFNGEDPFAAVNQMMDSMMADMGMPPMHMPAGMGRLGGRGMGMGIGGPFGGVGMGMLGSTYGQGHVQSRATAVGGDSGGGGGGSTFVTSFAGGGNGGMATISTNFGSG